MIRVIVDSQSNRLFRGVALEQNYDQRGGLCQVGEGHIVVTTNPIDPAYLDYWQGLGFALPHLLTAGPFDPRYTLSELILQNKDVQVQLKELIAGKPARLEFFCIEETEKRLAETLGVPAYCNFEVSIPLSRKIAFKQVCEKVGLPTPQWAQCENGAFPDRAKQLFVKGKNLLVKSNDGTGGIACGGMLKVENMGGLLRSTQKLGSGGNVLVEKLIEDKVAELSVHWEMDGRETHLIGVFEQLSSNFGYEGAAWPVDSHLLVALSLEEHLNGKLIPFLIQRKAVGYFCCDVILDSDYRSYWVDFNPRKGAILYVYDMVRRLSQIQFGGRKGCFWHEHCRLPQAGVSFQYVRQRLQDFLQPSHQPFVVVTNPGVIPFGYVDIMGVSHDSKHEARKVFQEAKRLLLG